MNIQNMDLLKYLKNNIYTSQKDISNVTDYSVGTINQSLNSLLEMGYLNADYSLTKQSLDYIADNSPKRAIILAAGFGMRMVPINTQVPKALLEVHGETLIERIINQLHEKGINEIYVIVGFMKEQFEYLIDEYSVNLIINEVYAEKNNMYSLFLAREYLDNAYVVPGDLYCNDNPFDQTELYSWYLLSNELENESTVRVNRKQEVVTCNERGNKMIGISYFTKECAGVVRNRLEKMSVNTKYDNAFWEDALLDKNKYITYARVCDKDDIYEINTYEQLRELDSNSNQLKNDAISVIVEALNVEETEIHDIRVLKKGMTNRSFLFTCNNEKFIMRIPGEGTEHLISRKQEADVYTALSQKGLCDDPVYINPENGYKITKFLNDVRVCDTESEEDLHICMNKLKEFHNMNLKVDHTFDIFGQIEFYESLWDGAPSIYKDYKKIKTKVFSLKSYIEDHTDIWCLTHIDAVPDNFLFYTEDNEEKLQLTDWEYAGMQDPHVDIAMFCIYSMYDREQVDHLIDIYFDNNCPAAIRVKIYCYIAVCGLLWSNWCEYKRSLGIEFGEYSLRQYRYAKEYYKIVMEEQRSESR